MKNKGFTLIELLVVIAIIGLLSSVVLASLNTARSKSRDAQRISDVRQLQTALEFFYDEHGRYPRSTSCGATSPNSGWCNSVQSMSGGQWIRNGGGTSMSEFLPSMSEDPSQETSPVWTPANGGTYFYFSADYGGDGEWYMIIFGLEDASHPLQAQDGVTACDGHYFHYGSGSNGVITVGGNCNKVN